MRIAQWVFQSKSDEIESLVAMMIGSAFPRLRINAATAVNFLYFSLMVYYAHPNTEFQAYISSPTLSYILMKLKSRKITPKVLLENLIMFPGKAMHEGKMQIASLDWLKYYLVQKKDRCSYRLLFGTDSSNDPKKLK